MLLNLLLAVPTAVVAAQADVGQRLNAQEFRLAELRVDLTAREEDAKLKASVEAAQANKQPGSPAQPNQAQIAQAANHIAHVFERNLGQSYAKLLRSSRPEDQLASSDLLRARADMRTAKARRDILLISADDQPDGRIYVDLDPVRPGDMPQGLSRGAEQTIPGVMDSSMNVASDLGRDDGRPITTIGRAMAQQIHDVMMSSAAARDALMSASASFSDVARPSQVAEILLAEVFSGTSHAVTADFMVPEMQDWLGHSVSAPLGERVTAALSNSYRATLLETRDLAKANAVVAQVADQALATADFSALRPTIEASLPTDSDSAEILRKRHPGLRQVQDAKAVALQHDMMRTLYTAQLDPLVPSDEHEKQMQAAIDRAGATQSYEDVVPPTTGAGPSNVTRGPPDSGIASADTGLGGGGGGGGGGGFGGGGGAGEHPVREPKAMVRPASAASVARGRSFFALRGFSRVGGVLIGRDPEAGSPALDFPVFQWTREAGGVRFHFGAANGSTLDAGPFHASVVHGALAYAADGRALTATMISAEPLCDLKILVHPALLDTTLGCRAISIDRFADETTGENQYPERARAERGFQADVMLYEMARAAILDSVVDRLDAENKDYLRESTAAAHDLIEQIQNSGGDELRSIIGSAAGVDPATRTGSGLHRFDHFSPIVVGLVEACQGPGATAEAFVSCTRDHSQREFGTKDFQSFRDRFVSVAQPVPTFQIWSGVRETPFTPDPKLSFLTKPGPDAIQFMVQVAFTSKPYQKILGDGGTSDEASDQTDPYEFENLRITDKVLEMIGTNPQKRDVFDGVVEFTALQRLFRLALAGQLGAGFPVEKLAELESATRGDVKRQPTPRWTPHGGDFTFLMNLASNLSDMPAGQKAKAAACLKANGLPPSPADAGGLQTLYDDWKRRTPISSQEWAQTCVFQDTAASTATEKPGSTSDLIRYSQRFPAIRDLRHSLGVDTADRGDDERCGPL